MGSRRGEGGGYVERTKGQRITRKGEEREEKRFWFDLFVGLSTVWSTIVMPRNAMQCDLSELWLGRAHAY